MLQRLVKRFDNHSLTSSELSYWTRHEKGGFSRSVSRVLVGTVTIFCLLLFLYEIIAVQFSIDLKYYVNLQIEPNIGVLLTMGGVILVLWAFLLPYQDVRIFAQKLIARDKINKLRWEMIVLTGVDARSYVRAKWWTIMWMTAPRFLPSAIIRAGLLAFMVGELTRLGIDDRSVARGLNVIDSPTTLDILLLGGLTILFTYLGLPRLVADSLDTMLDFPRHGNTWWGLGLRTGVGCIEFFVTLLVPLAILTIVLALQLNWIILWVVGMVLWTSLDGGVVLSAQLAAYIVWGREAYFLLPNAGWVIFVLALALPIILARTWLSFKLLERTAQRYGLVATKRNKNDG